MPWEVGPESQPVSPHNDGEIETFRMLTILEVEVLMKNQRIIREGPDGEKNRTSKRGAGEFNLEEELRKISETYGISVDDARERFNEYLEAAIPINTKKNKKDETLQRWCLEVVKKYLGREFEERASRRSQA